MNPGSLPGNASGTDDRWSCDTPGESASRPSAGAASRACASCAAHLQFDAQLPHAMNVVRGMDGKGAAGLPCATCHAENNPPASYGPHAPPGAPHWSLPPAAHKMAWIGLPPDKLCAMIKDRSSNGDRDFAALIKHVSEDKLVLWGWNPGAGRAPVPVPHDIFVAQFKLWADAGGPCPVAQM